MKPLSALLAILLWPRQYLREKHLIHSWKYNPTPEGHLTRRACTVCPARQCIDPDDWGASWVADTAPVERPAMVEVEEVEAA